MLRLSTGLIVLDESGDPPARLMGCVVVADAPVIGTPTGITGPVGVAVLPVNGPLPFANTVPSRNSHAASFSLILEPSHSQLTPHASHPRHSSHDAPKQPMNPTARTPISHHTSCINSGHPETPQHRTSLNSTPKLPHVWHQSAYRGHSRGTVT